jgi:hypothetical protein
MPVKVINKPCNKTITNRTVTKHYKKKCIKALQTSLLENITKRGVAEHHKQISNQIINTYN